MSNVLKDTLAAQMSAGVIFNEEAKLNINGTDFIISGFFDKVDNAHDPIGNISRLSYSHRFITAADIVLSDADVRESTLNGMKIKRTMKDSIGMTVIYLL